MSAEDNSSAEPADIGEALVAALGFEPTDGRKGGRKAAAADAGADGAADIADEALSVVSPENESGPGGDTVADAPSGDATNGRSTNGSGGSGGSGSSATNRKKSRNRNQGKNTSNNRGGQKGGSSGSGNSSTDSSTSKQKDGPLKNIKSAAEPKVSGTGPNANKSGPGSQSGPASQSGPGSAGAASKGASAKADGVKDAASNAGPSTAAAKKAAAAKAATAKTADAKSTDAKTDPAKSGTGAGASKPGGANKSKAGDANKPVATKPGGSRADSTKGAAAASDSSRADSSKSDGGKSRTSAKGQAGAAGSAKTGGSPSGSGARSDAATTGRSGVDKAKDGKSKIAAAAAASVTGDLTDAVKESAEELPPPPSASDAIKIDTPAVAEVVPDESAPSSPPVKGGQAAKVGDKTSRSEKMSAAAKAATLPTSEATKPAVSDAAATVADARVDLPDVDSSPAPFSQDPSPTNRVDVVKPASSPKSDLLPAGAPDLAAVRNIFRRKRRVQARKVRRVVRHIDPWSVLTFSVLFHLSVFAALLLASVLVWNAAEAAGTIENLETFILELGDYETFEIKGDVVFQAAVAIAGVLTLASSVMLVLLTVVFNLISDLVGGIRLTVIEEETVRVRRRKKSA